MYLVLTPYTNLARSCFYKKYFKKQKIRIHKNGQQKRDFIFVEKVCEKLTNSVLKI